MEQGWHQIQQDPRRTGIVASDTMTPLVAVPWREDEHPKAKKKTKEKKERDRELTSVIGSR